MANPQPDKHVRISTEVLEALGRFRIPGEARQIIDAIIRRTWGWNKKEDEISNSQLAEMTGLFKGNVSRSLSSLITHKLIVISQDNKTRFNKNYDEWVKFEYNNINRVKVISQDNSEIVITQDKKVISQDNKSLSSVRGTIDNKDILQKTIQSPIENTINKTMKLFGSINPSYDQLFRRKTQRGAVERLAKKYSYSQLIQLIEAARQANGQPFAPTITTPCQLEDKLGQLKSFYDKNQKKGVRVWKTD